MRIQMVGVALAALVVAACSGGGGDSSSPGPDPSTTVVATDAPAPTEPAETSPTATVAPATTTVPTTEPPPPPPEPYPAGVVWSEPVEVFSERSGIKAGTFKTVDLGDEIWIFGDRWNGSVAARSSDAGQSWTEVTFAPPPESGLTVVRHLVRGAEGRYLALATHSSASACSGGAVVDDGFRGYQNCTRRRAVVFVSDDGETWTESAPAGLAAPSGASLRINDLIVVDGGYLAAGTYEGPGWRAVLLASPDGLTWTVEREFVGDGNPMTSRSLAYDGTTLVFTADETPCSQLYDNVGGWVLGTWWAKHGRIFEGSDVASLTLRQPGEHPLAPEPLEPLPDCGFIDDLPYQSVPYPKFSAEVIDGTLSLLELYVPREQTAQVEAAEEANDDELLEQLRSTLGTRRYTQLIDGEWAVTDIDAVNVLAAGALNQGAEQRGFEWYPIDIAGGPAFVEVRATGRPLHDVFTVTDNDPAQVSSVAPVVFTLSLGAHGVADGYMLITAQLSAPFLPYRNDDPVSVVAWHTYPGEDLPAPRCDLEPGGTCRFADLREHPDYPDFAGRNLTGVDLTGTDIGSAVFDGADLSAARLWLVTSERNPAPTFVGADLTGAQLQRADIGDISGAVVDGANFTDGRILRADGVDFSNAAMIDVNVESFAGATFGSTDVTGARLYIRSAAEMPDLASLTYDDITVAVHFDADGQIEIDLSGLDLTGVSFQGESDRDNLTIVTGLDGTVLDDTRLGYVDLSRIDPAIDLTEVRVGNESICPDGAPAEGFTCVRGG